MKSTGNSILVGTLVVGAVFISALSEINAQTLQQAPDNPAFLRYQQESAQKASTAKTVFGHARGYIPSPVDLSHLRGRSPAGMRALQALPSSYDLRTMNKLTPIRDQNPYGTCWAFATYSSLESTLMPGETNDFSVNSMVNNHGFDYTYNQGGGALMSIAYLSRWSGPINSSDDPYTNGPGHSPAGLTVQKHVQEVLLLPLKTSALDNTAIKQVVMDYGAMYVGMCSDFDTNNYYNSTNFSFYYTGNSNADHAVAIVGWDDNYPAANFKQTPPGNGAYIVRNSWGTNWGVIGCDNGYFYCSYYDKVMGYDENVSFDNAAAVTNYSSVYQYDPLGWVNSYGYNSTNAWAANIFTATNNETLRAVAFYTTDIDVNYEIYIYKNVTAGNPVSGTLKVSQVGSTAYSGYHTIALNTPVTVSSGTLFSVVVRLMNPSYKFPVAYEYAKPEYSSRATSSPGESYVAADENSWTDITTTESTANVCIKAFCISVSYPTSIVTSVAADFDGDAKADPAVYNTNGTWKIRLSSNPDYPLVTLSGFLGEYGCSPLAADFDGDRLADMAIYNGVFELWMIKLSSTRYLVPIDIFSFGGAEWEAIAGDFDGDRLADPAIYHASTGTWKMMLSSARYQVITKTGMLGWVGWQAIASDIDGDGKVDPAIYQASTGSWVILLSRSNYALAVLEPNFLGSAGYNGMAADFDGDAKADPTIAETSTGNWKIRLSSGNYTLVNLPGFLGE